MSAVYPPRGPGVSYLEVERAAIAILKAGHRPSVERVRATLGHGSPQTLLTALQRFWRDLGSRVEADPAALSRLPVEIVELVDGVWQRALTLASQSAKNDDNAARERLAQRQLEIEVRAKSLQVREQEWEMAARAREQTLADAREQAMALLQALEVERVTRAARERRIEMLERQLEALRRQSSLLIGQTRNGGSSSRRSPEIGKPRGANKRVRSRALSPRAKRR